MMKRITMATLITTMMLLTLADSWMPITRSAVIAAIFAAAKIGISSVIQPEGHEGESVPLILMIHDAPNAAMRKALDKIAKLPPVKGKPVMFRVESFD